MNEMLQRLGEAAKAAASETAKLGVSEKKTRVSALWLRRFSEMKGLYFQPMPKM